MKRLMRKPRWSSDKVPVPAAIRRTRATTCATKAPANSRNNSQNVSVPRRPHDHPLGPRRPQRKPILCELRARRGLLFQGLDERRNDFEQVADDPVIGDLENWGVWVFIDGGNRARPLH